MKRRTHEEKRESESKTNWSKTKKIMQIYVVLVHYTSVLLTPLLLFMWYIIIFAVCGWLFFVVYIGEVKKSFFVTRYRRFTIIYFIIICQFAAPVLSPPKIKTERNFNELFQKQHHTCVCLFYLYFFYCI